MIIIERVKFYSIEDMSIDDNFNLAIKFIKNLDSNKKDYEINDILEMFNILKLFQNDILKQVEKETSDLCKNSKNLINKIIGKYYNKINNDNVNRILVEIDDIYIEDFFELIDKYKIYERISSDVFIKIISSKKIYLNYVLTNKNLVYYYDEDIKNILLKTDNSAEFLLDNYEIDHIGHIKKKYFYKLC